MISSREEHLRSIDHFYSSREVRYDSTLSDGSSANLKACLLLIKCTLAVCFSLAEDAKPKIEPRFQLIRAGAFSRMRSRRSIARA